MNLQKADLIRLVSGVVREADMAFEESGGTSRHWVREQFLPRLAEAGLRIHAEPFVVQNDTEVHFFNPEGHDIRVCDCAMGAELKYPIVDIEDPKYVALCERAKEMARLLNRLWRDER